MKNSKNTAAKVADVTLATAIESVSTETQVVAEIPAAVETKVESADELTTVARTTGPIEKPLAKRRSHCTTIPVGKAPSWEEIINQAGAKLGIFDKLGNAIHKYKIIFETEPEAEKVTKKKSSIRTIIAEDDSVEKGLTPPNTSSFIADAIAKANDETYDETAVVDPNTVSQN